MRKVYQTPKAKNKGNCLTACVASIFDKTIDQVPYFLIMDNWWDGLQRYVRSTLRYRAFRTKYPPYRNGYYICVGYQSPGALHASVAMNDTIVHNPNRKTEFLPWISFEYYIGFYKINN